MAKEEKAAGEGREIEREIDRTAEGDRVVSEMPPAKVVFPILNDAAEVTVQVTGLDRGDCLKVCGMFFSVAKQMNLDAGPLNIEKTNNEEEV